MPTSIDNNPLFNERSCLSLDEIKDYTGKKLDGASLHDMEAHMASCALCSDAVEGYMAIPAFDLSSELGRRGRGTAHWTNGATRGVILLGIGLSVAWSVWYFSQPIQQPVSNKVEVSSDEVVLYDPAEELVELNEVVEQAIEIPVTEQVGHKQDELISKPAENELAVIAPTEKLVRDTSDQLIIINPQVPAVGKLHEKPRPKLNRLPVSNRQLLFLNNLKLVHPDEMYALYSSRPDLTGTSASEGTAQEEDVLRTKVITYTELLEKASAAYITEDHKGAAKLLNMWLSKEPKDVNAQFYVGLCYYNLGLYEQAYENLELARTNKIDTFQEEATWYSALSHEQLNGFESTKTLYEQISVLGGFYSDRAFKKLNP